MIPGFILLFQVAVMDWLAVAKSWKRVEFIAKPATMLVLLGLLAIFGNFSALPVVFFGLGIFFSLAGDVLMLVSYTRFSNDWFLPGMIAFLLAHIAYIVGLNTPMPNVSPIWSLGLAVILGLTAVRILRRILDGVIKQGLPRLVRPVALYGIVITVMLLSALLTVNNSAWKISSSGLVALGAVSFYFSDLLLAWEKFVSPIRNGKLAIMMLYHLGQFGLVAGVLLQFAK
jgi:uncharacterized membrane protein YhhN